MSAEIFLDTNALVYLLSDDDVKANRVEQIMCKSPVISVQVLNEFTNVVRRKLKMPWVEIDELIDAVQASCSIKPLTVAVHTQGRKLAQRFSFSVYDAMIVSSALEAECTILYSEDMQDGLHVENNLIIRNPFV